MPARVAQARVGRAVERCDLLDQVSRKVGVDDFLLPDQVEEA
jgi:hypothetical protein